MTKMSPVKRHADLPMGMQMFAQLIVEGIIIQQSMPMDLKNTQDSPTWKLVFNCDIPQHVASFQITIMRKSEGTRLLGSIEIERDQALLAGEKQICIPPFVKVNPDGPLLEVIVAFSVSTFSHKPAELDTNNVSDIQIGLANDQAISTQLEEMLDKGTEMQLDLQDLWAMHERILLHHTSDKKRGKLLNLLGNICLQQWQLSHTIPVLNQAICAHMDAVRDGLADANSLYDLGLALLPRVQQLGEVNDLNKCVQVMQDAIRLTPDGHPDKLLRLTNLGASFFYRFQQLGDMDDISRFISIGEDTVHQTPDGDPEKPSRLANLGASLFYRFEKLGALDDISRAISIGEDIVHLTSDDHPGKALRLTNLGGYLLRRFEQLGDLDDLKRSISIGEDAVRLTPDDNQDKPLRLNNLGSSLVTRFEQLGELDDLNRSISIVEDAVRLTPDGHPHKPARLTNLGASLLRRFARLGNLDDLNRSISMVENAVHLTIDGHPNKISMLINLENSLLTRFDSLGDLNDLNRTISIGEDTVQLIPDNDLDKPFILSNLGNSLHSRFKHLSDLDDLNRSVFLGEKAVSLTPDGHPNKPVFLGKLGRSLRSRFERLGDLEDLNRSISITENAVSLTPDDHINKPGELNDFGNSLFHRFEWLGNLEDLNRSILIVEDAIRLTPEGYLDRSLRLNNLGNSFRTQDAVHLSPDGTPDKPLMLNNLGNSLLARFERFGDPDDLNRSISIREDAIPLTPNDNLAKPSILNNLGNSLRIRFECLRDLNDSNRSISIGEDAVRMTPDGHPAKPFRVNNLGLAFHARFEWLGNVDDLGKSISMGKNAVHMIPHGHPDKPLMLKNLANSLFTRFERLSDHTALKEAIPLYALAALSATGPAHVRFNSASMWAKTAKIQGHPSLLHAYHVALGILPELAWLGLSISDRHYHLLEAGKVVRDAAAAAIVFGQPEKAVEWLEQGRSIIWGQLLNLRSPVDILRTSHPKLADQLLSLSTQLERSGTRASHPETTASSIQGSLQSIADQAHQNTHKRRELLTQIRGLEGFVRFLLPRTIYELSQAGKQGPIVVLNVGTDRCDALILMPGLDDEVMHISLADFTPKDARSLAQTLSHLVGRGVRLDGQREGDIDPEDAFENNLAKLWLGVVRPVLDGLAITTPHRAKFPRIWWCPTGPLAFLPIHAAGLYGKNDSFGSKLSDFMISSYVPSLTAMIESFRAPSKSQQGVQILAVAQPSAFGQAYIPGTQEEITHIQRLANGTVPVLRLEEDMATVESVQQGMQNSRWVHFACHGVQNISYPTESALLLAGSSRLTLSDIIQLALPNADLAFLSACQTATGDKSLEEESVHLAAGMLLAGYRGVIATMWTIMDNDGPHVASGVYEHLFKTSPPDPARAAEALHLAVQKLRQRSSAKKSFFHWVPFIHIGV
ncbi:CHAT domain-containing protein [Mycena rosella]|uniref:CHAT domain-containing protein n=1 Tax=Mycena rosella TaxID=1033263 RepID=A0AAD7C6K0_MYCRO|nr:CHAT domain-containing protein [Mycena rosella]